MIEVGVVAQFEAAHSLKGDFGPATRRHGHTYRVEAAVRGNALRADGTLFDITLLQDAVQAVAADLHYQDLDELPDFADRNTTIEVLAQHFYDLVSPKLGGQALESLMIRVWESPQAYAAVDGRLA